MSKINTSLHKILLPGTYSITINPERQEKFFKDATLLKKATLMKTIFHDVERIQKMFVDTAQLILYPDLSAPKEMYPGTYPRLHYHGWIKIFKPLKFYLILAEILNKSNNRMSISIDTISCYTTWHAYSVKSQPLFKLQNYITPPMVMPTEPI